MTYKFAIKLTQDNSLLVDYIQLVEAQSNKT